MRSSFNLRNQREKRDEGNQQGTTSEAVDEKPEEHGALEVK